VMRKFKLAAGRKGVAFAARGNRSWMVRNGTEEWLRLDSEERYIDLARFFGEYAAETACAAVEVRSGKMQCGSLWASAAGKMRVLLNGQTVVEKEQGSGHEFAEFKVDVELAEGINRLEVQVEPCEEGMGFTALLCDADGYGLRDIEYRLDS